MSVENAIHLTPSLQPGADERATSTLRTYFGEVQALSGFTGSRFDDFDPSGTKSASSNVFTADDLCAVTLLSVQVPPRAAIDLLERDRARFSDLLSRIDDEVDLVDVESTDPVHFPANELWDALRALPGVGRTITSKLMARKRPRLIPIFDSVINEHLLRGSGVLWEPLRLELRAGDRSLHERLLHLRAAAGLGEHISTLRILDVLAWMDGTAARRAQG